MEHCHHRDSRLPGLFECRRCRMGRFARSAHSSVLTYFLLLQLDNTNNNNNEIRMIRMRRESNQDVQERWLLFGNGSPSRSSSVTTAQTVIGSPSSVSTASTASSTSYSNDNNDDTEKAAASRYWARMNEADHDDRRHGADMDGADDSDTEKAWGMRFWKRVVFFGKSQGGHKSGEASPEQNFGMERYWARDNGDDEGATEKNWSLGRWWARRNDGDAQAAIPLRKRILFDSPSSDQAHVDEPASNSGDDRDTSQAWAYRAW